MSDVAARATHAKRLMDDPLLIEAFASVKAAAIRAWEQTSAENTQAREMAWLTVKVINRIEAELQSMVDDGTIAAARVQRPLGSN